MQPVIINVEIPEEQVAMLKEIHANQKTLLKNVSDTTVWLSDDGVAKRFSVSVSLITKWRKDFGLPFSQIGEIRRYQVKDVDKWFGQFSTNRILAA